jgi:hypothetical protein
MVKGHQTKPKPPMEFAPRAQDTVGIGKPRTAYITPVTAGHYQVLPPRWIKPNTPKNLDSIADCVGRAIDTVAIVAPRVRRPGGPMHHPDRPNGIVLRGAALPNHTARWSRAPHPTTRSFWAYGLIFVIKAIYFGKEFLRMAGIVQMLHGHKPPSDNYQYANRIRVRSL